MFLHETWLEDTCSAAVLNEIAHPNFNFTYVFSGLLGEVEV